jgi:hypothetical protein
MPRDNSISDMRRITKLDQVDSVMPLGFPAPDGEAADGRHASDHARSPIYRATAPRCLSKKALISPKASFVSGA